MGSEKVPFLVSIRGNLAHEAMMRRNQVNCRKVRTLMLLADMGALQQRIALKCGGLLRGEPPAAAFPLEALPVTREHRKSTSRFRLSPHPAPYVTRNPTSQSRVPETLKLPQRLPAPLFRHGAARKIPMGRPWHGFGGGKREGSKKQKDLES